MRQFFESFWGWLCLLEETGAWPVLLSVLFFVLTMITSLKTANTAKRIDAKTSTMFERLVEPGLRKEKDARKKREQLRHGIVAVVRFGKELEKEVTVQELYTNLAGVFRKGDIKKEAEALREEGQLDFDGWTRPTVVTPSP